ncbi:MAG: hypothetical protein ABSG68_25265 [Thermoguttaceae bacterium]|jgi:hypothetical protein
MLKITELLRLFTAYILALGLAAAMATAGAAQDFIPPPPASADSVAPILPLLSDQAPNPGMPVLDPSAAAPTAATAPPEQAPGTAAPSPEFIGKNNEEREPGDMMDFGGRGGMEGLGFGSGGGMFPADSFRYSAIWFPNVPVHGQPGDFQMIGQDLSFSHPLWRDPLDALSLSGGVRNRLIETDAILPDTGQAIPSDLWSVHLGLRYNRQLENGWLAGGGVSIGSASDHPFATIREMNVGVNGMLRIPQGEHNAWLLSLMYSPTGQLNFPVPGIAYSWNPSPQFHANIGLPLQVTWRPADDWQFQASYMLISTIHAKAQYRLTKRLSAFAAYDWSNEAYSLLDRPEENDRFFIYDQRVSMGLQMVLLRHWTASLSSGFVFDRYLFEGTSFFGSSANRVNLGAGPFVSLNLGARY